MDPMTIGSLISVGKSLIERVWPDPQKQAEELRKLKELEQQGDLAELQAFVDTLKGQIEINKIEAESPSIFKSGWRPATGWTCVLGLFYTFIFAPVFGWAVSLIAYFSGADLSRIPMPPDLDMGNLLTILLGMLGLAGYRTFEKIKGVAAK